MNLVFRPATLADVDQLYDVRMSVQENTILHRSLIPRTIVNQVLVQGGSWVCVDRDRVVGFGMADAEGGELFGLFVRPEYEGRGIGTRLMHLLMDWMKSKGLKKVTLRTDRGTRAEALYRKLGWKSGKAAKFGEITFTYTF